MAACVSQRLVRHVNLRIGADDDVGHRPQTGDLTKSRANPAMGQIPRDREVTPIPAAVEQLQLQARTDVDARVAIVEKALAEMRSEEHTSELQSHSFIS